MRLKLETNTREHFHVTDLVYFPFSVESKWFKGSCRLTRYTLEELLGTKLRALYQREKGRDLFDLYVAFNHNISLNTDLLLRCYREYMAFSTDHPPGKKEFILNLEAKITDPEFAGDTKGLLRSDVNYDPLTAYAIVKSELIDKI